MAAAIVKIKARWLRRGDVAILPGVGKVTVLSREIWGGPHRRNPCVEMPEVVLLDVREESGVVRHLKGSPDGDVEFVEKVRL